jgi:hypothetical protein
MFVFYKIDTGNIVFTIEGESYPEHLVSETTGVIETTEPLGDIACWQVVEGALVKVTLEPIKAAYLERIRQAIADVRVNFITDIVGQDSIYKAKRDEAARYIADPAPDLANYPFIKWEIGLTAPTGYELAQTWLYMNESLEPIAAQLENIRLTATYVIEAASTEEEITSAYAVFEASIAAFLTAVGV